MDEDKIYPSMVIRTQAEKIKLLEKENKDLKEKIEIEKHHQLIEDYQVLYLKNKELQEKVDLINKEKTDICNQLVKYREKSKRQKQEITHLLEIKRKEKEKNGFLMQRDNKCQILEQIIKRIKEYIENHKLDHRINFESLIKANDILDILKEVE